MQSSSLLLTGGDGSTLDTVDIFGDGSGLALWQFNDDVLDVGGTYDGTAYSVTYEAGVHDNAMRCGATTANYVDLNVPSPAGEFAFAGWINIKDTATVQYIMGSNNNATGYVRGFDLFVSNTRAGLQTGDGTFGQDKIEPTIPDGFIGWHYIVIGVEIATKFTMIDIDNGTYTASATASYAPEHSHYDVHLGRQGDSVRIGEAAFDQLRYFNKIPNATEISTLYNES